MLEPEVVVTRRRRIWLFLVPVVVAVAVPTFSRTVAPSCEGQTVRVTVARTLNPGELVLDLSRMACPARLVIDLI